MTQTLYYLDDYTDEIVPCSPTLAGWAEWLSKPDPEWSNHVAAKDGDTFSAHTLIILGDVKVEHIEGEWRAVEPIPEGTDIFYLRRFEGSEGWDADYCADTIADAAGGLEPDEGPLWFACTKDGGALHLIYRADGPTLEIVRPQ